MIPTGVIVAVTNMTFVLGVPIDVLSSVILPGNPIGFLTLRTYTNSCQHLIINFLISFKIAHYMKIPPRITFYMLLICPMVAGIVQYITAIYLLNHVPNICTHENPSWKCLYVETLYIIDFMECSFVKTFGVGSIYFPLLFGLLLGLVLPIISWFLWKKFPNIKWLAFIHFPMILVATNNVPPAPAGEYTTWFLVGFIFNLILYRYAHAWWEKYAYVFSAAMSCGVAICGFIIFITLQNNNIKFPEWWGTGGPTRDGCPLEIANYSGYVVTD
ncbi:unnamed protein product [Rotaria sp. Silwood1]|nr:unnamed protein product [Rotaria sp. Silwood1]